MPVWCRCTDRHSLCEGLSAWRDNKARPFDSSARRAADGSRCRRDRPGRSANVRSAIPKSSHRHQRVGRRSKRNRRSTTTSSLRLQPGGRHRHPRRVRLHPNRNAEIKPHPQKSVRLRHPRKVRARNIPPANKPGRNLSRELVKSLASNACFAEAACTPRWTRWASK